MAASDRSAPFLCKGLEDQPELLCQSGFGDHLARQLDECEAEEWASLYRPSTGRGIGGGFRPCGNTRLRATELECDAVASKVSGRWGFARCVRVRHPGAG